ncbi:hypothetical protein PLESTF_000757400 [Pleodorina starrii]|nr:hypothetical protein PLESTF_000757400 [Pleodorina starrii]
MGRAGPGRGEPDGRCAVWRDVQLRTVALAGSDCGYTGLTCWWEGCCNTLRTPAMSAVLGMKGMHLVWVDEQYQLCAGLDPGLQQLANTWPQHKYGSQWCLDGGVHRSLWSKGCLAGRGRCCRMSADESFTKLPGRFFAVRGAHTPDY